MFIVYKNHQIDLSQPLDISIALSDSDKNPIAWYLEKPSISPVVNGDWIGKVSTGKSSTNFNNIAFNPHGHGTHTECVGHITAEFYSVNDCLKTFFFDAILISLLPEKINGDDVITENQLQLALQENRAEAIIIRTLPNKIDKKSFKYSHTNPPFLSEAAAVYLRNINVKHLLIDLPSVDKEHDEGKLLAHKAFWNVTDTTVLNVDARMDCTITEMIFVPDSIPDGHYLLNLQMASFVNDASPSKPILYELK